MLKGIQTIIDILRSPEYPQTTGTLARFNDEGEIESKCALGEISCRVGVPIIKDHRFPSYRQILDNAGLPHDIVHRLFMPDYTLANDENGQVFLNIKNIENATLDEWIYVLNDCRFTYDEIADFLETTFQDCEDDTK